MIATRLVTFAKVRIVRRPLVLCVHLYFITLFTLCQENRVSFVISSNFKKNFVQI